LTFRRRSLADEESIQSEGATDRVKMLLVK
jgi:hypothetical protein